MATYRYSRLTTDDIDDRRQHPSNSGLLRKTLDNNATDDEVFTSNLKEPTRERVATTGSYDLKKFKEDLRRKLHIGGRNDDGKRHFSLTNGEALNDVPKSSSDLSLPAYKPPTSNHDNGGIVSPTAVTKKKWTRNQWITIMILSIFLFVSTVAYSLLSPFFPAEASKKKLSSLVTGMIFGFYELVIFLTSPFLGKMVSLAHIIYFFTAFSTDCSRASCCAPEVNLHQHKVSRIHLSGTELSLTYLVISQVNDRSTTWQLTGCSLSDLDVWNLINRFRPIASHVILR